MTTVLNVHDYIAGVSATSEDSEYPVENVQNDHVREKWRALNAGATLDLVIKPGATCIGIAGLNAASLIVSIGTGGKGFEEGSADSFDLGAADSFNLVAMDEWDVIAEYYDLNESGVGTLMVIYAALSVQHIVSIEIVADGEAARAGIARAGLQSEFNQPMRGIGEGLVSNDVVVKMRSGAPHIDPGDPRALRRFDFEHQLVRSTDFYDFLHTIFMKNGMDPLFWRVVDSETETTWVLYAMPDGSLPRGTHAYNTRSYLRTNIIEVV